MPRQASSSQALIGSNIDLARSRRGKQGLGAAHSLLPRKTKSQFIGPYVISHVVIRYSCPTCVAPPPLMCFACGSGFTMHPGALTYVVRFGSAKLHTGVPLHLGAEPHQR